MPFSQLGDKGSVSKTGMFIILTREYIIFISSSEPCIHEAYNKDYIVFYDFERLSKYLQICMTKMEIRAIKH